MPLNPYVEKSGDSRQGGQVERRSAPRFVLQLPISATILISATEPDLGPLKGHTTVFATEGMDLRLDDIIHGQYLKLLAKQRYIRITFISFLDDKEIYVTGKILGIDYHKQKVSRESGVCDLKVLFEQGKSSDLSRYFSFVNSLTSSG